jgi:BirA family transcriptional regulator, biotin operon repressor / biotin---[acetyl-CoA-carboxylase] ligase
MLSKVELQHDLHTTVVGKKFFVFESIDSTNACAKTLAEANCEEGTVIVTEAQTAGKGRLGRTWTSEPGENLLFSIVLRPKIAAEQAGMLSLFAAVATSAAIETTVKIKTACKWPNDLLLNEKKCCGILLESSLLQTSLKYAIVGIGLNVNQTQFHDELKPRATSLKLASGKDIDRTTLLKNILEHIDRYYAIIQTNDWSTVLNEWRQRAAMLGSAITMIHENQQIRGIARDITSNGGLILATPSGTRIFYAGEATLSPHNEFSIKS